MLKKQKKQKQKKVFVHNGIKYHRMDDTVLIKIKDNSNNFIGIEYDIVDSTYFNMKNVVKEKEGKAFIFMLSKEVYDSSGVNNTINMLKKSGLDLSIFNGEFTGVIV